MNIEVIILIIAWILTTAILMVFTPKGKLREALLIFLFKQFITWLVGLIVVEFRLIEYHYDFFPYANRTSFSFEFFFYPATCVIFVLHYPEKRKILGQFLYYFYFCTVITVAELVLERYTQLLTYLNWHWYTTWITLFITFYITRQFYLWFFRLKKNA